MAKGRSPNCPQMSLQEAIERTRRVYAEEHKHPAQRSVIAEHLGYKSLNGASLTALGGLRQYGLLEDDDGGMRVSDDAVTLLELHEGEPEHDAALRKLAFHPPFFQELYQAFGAQLPSEANLRHYLIKKGFLPKRADEVIRVYRENIELVGADDTGYTEPEMQTPDQDSEQSTNPVLVRKTAQAIIRGGDPAQLQARLQTESRSYAFDISIPRQVKGELKIVGQFGKEDLERLKKALNGQLAMIEAALED